VDLPGLVVRLRAAKLPGTPIGLAERSRKALVAYVESAAAHGLPFADIVRRLADGRAAETVAKVERQEAAARGKDPAQGAACGKGCAFCCILSGADGGTITAFEARRLHAALAPLAGTPDGRDWHPRACPALDPETRMCRAYDARPTLCRSYHSIDAAACEANAQGAAREGARLAGAHLTYLAAHGLARGALGRQAAVDTFALYDVAAGAVSGAPLEATLAAARHAPEALDAERKRTGKALRDAPRQAGRARRA
jgi:Fe-S-cluster containining protein